MDTQEVAVSSPKREFLREIFMSFVHFARVNSLHWEEIGHLPWKGTQMFVAVMCPSLIGMLEMTA